MMLVVRSEENKPNSVRTLRVRYALQWLGNARRRVYQDLVLRLDISPPGAQFHLNCQSPGTNLKELFWKPILLRYPSVCKFLLIRKKICYALMLGIVGTSSSSARCASGRCWSIVRFSCETTSSAYLSRKYIVRFFDNSVHIRYVMTKELELWRTVPLVYTSMDDFW